MSRKAQVQDVQIVQGKRVLITVTVTQNGEPDGPVEPIDAATAIRYVIAADADSTAIITKTLGAGINPVGVGTGQYTIELDPVDTAQLDRDQAPYFQESDLDLGNGVEAVFRGNVDVVNSVLT